MIRPIIDHLNKSIWSNIFKWVGRIDLWTYRKIQMAFLNEAILENEVHKTGI